LGVASTEELNAVQSGRRRPFHANPRPAARELAASVAKGAADAAGGLALLAAGHYAFPFLEFVATNLSVVKQYAVVAFQHSQMSEIVDAIEFEYNRLKRLIK
jgi:hypothetical protein